MTFWKVCDDECWELLEGEVNKPYHIIKSGVWILQEGSFGLKSEFTVVKTK